MTKYRATSENTSKPTYRRRQGALLAVMFSFGLIFSTWTTRTPAIRDALDVSIAQMGVMMLGLSVGSMIGVLSSATLISYFDTRKVLTVGGTVGALAIAVVGIFTGLGLPFGVAFGLSLVGLGSGLCDIALNVEGAEIERLAHRSVLPQLHGFFSLGTVVGALAGIFLAGIAFPPMLHLFLISALTLPLVIWGILGVPSGFGIVGSKARETEKKSAKQRSVWLDPTVLLIGLIVLAMAFAEGSANDWLPLLIVDSQDAGEAAASLVYAGFAAAMTLGRFAGGPLVQRFGHSQTLGASALLGVIGVLGVVYAPNIGVAIAAVVLWGVGSSLGFPVAISAAGNTTDRPIKRVSTVTTWGYIAFLVGPPLLGFLGENAGLGNALLIVAALLFVAAVSATILTRRLRLTIPLPKSKVDEVFPKKS